ncbi:hypothetical protein [Blastococcus sp. VKM Ac-2987]|uniref:hypothetical protein n=1 Tax=Blastococcus sp. VKM Ac-2987 TaxID=3004141 RepID=UPI0022ABB1B2|nr:hypothetical protein [Blastococcus sp. VKM Ac-2987]MCZ2859572.1 hypothetical protein [Blastococcus sp. VKM Ac-2987]
MDVPTAAAWLVVGVVLVVLAVGAVAAGAAAVRRRGNGGGPAGAPAERVDDLADFLAHPPGTRPERPAPAGWATLAPAPPAAAGPRAAARRRTHAPLAALCVAALALVGTAAAVAAGSGSGGEAAQPAPGTGEAAPPSGDAAPPAGGAAPGGLVADLAVAGLVLEPRAVGITAAYPELLLTSQDGAARLELRLPTYNCLTAGAPRDPVAAGCVAAPVEHATLGPEQLRVQRDGDRLTVRGEAATATRPAGSPAEPTGRVYDVELTVLPEGGRAPDGWRPATGELRLGTGTAPLLADRSRIRPAG